MHVTEHMYMTKNWAEEFLGGLVVNIIQYSSELKNVCLEEKNVKMRGWKELAGIQMEFCCWRLETFRKAGDESVSGDSRHNQTVTYSFQILRTPNDV